jgi:hypothetical protein
MNEPKNKSAVHLGRLSANSRKEKLGETGFIESMKLLRQKGKQKETA